MKRLGGAAGSVIRWAWHQRRRFMKFGVVGLSGLAVNQATLWLGHEHLFQAVRPDSLRLNLAIALGIAVALTSNFLLNRAWTWRDFSRLTVAPIWIQYGRYAVANWAGILLTIAGTNLLAASLGYSLANLTSIALAAGVNFAVNDLWTFRHVRTEGLDPERTQLAQSRLALALAGAGLVLALSTYLFGLDSQHIPRNGDELVYAQITRLTAATGHWLPLRSGMADLENTKPPLLFWQGIISTDGGSDWSFWSLRWPSVAWTMATAALVGWLSWRMNRRDALAAVMAALVYLGFLGTYRYGRPYLTDAPEVFWSFACVALTIMWLPRSLESRWLWPLLVGVLAGFALLTKSFAQLAPIGLTLACWHLQSVRWDARAFIRTRLCGLVILGVVALAIFALWFALDPEPAQVWRDFVLRENAGKMGQGNYLARLLWGGSSLWSLAAGFFINAGVLGIPLFGVCVESWKHRSEVSSQHRMLWVFVLVTFLVFCIPDQRSERYLLIAMPALAVLMASHWRWVGRNAFVIALIVAGLVIAGIGWLSVLLARELGVSAFDWWHWLVIAGGISFCITAAIRPRWSAVSVAPACLLLYLALAGFLSVFDAPLGVWDEGGISAARGKRVWAPENFRSVAEQERFLLPGAEVVGFPMDGPTPEAASTGDLLILTRTISAAAPPGAVSSRVDITSRHTARQIWEMATGRVEEHLFCRHWLVPVSR